MDQPLESTVLYRIDRARNMARFYLMTVEPTLFGGSSLTRNWGRIGTSGQRRIELFDSPEEACAARARLARRKLDRGYRVADDRCRF